MKTIYLVRHAKAEPANDEQQDLERQLTKKGKKDLKEILKDISREGVIPDLMISSPAIRAVQTAQIFSKKLNYPEDKIEIKNLLNADPDEPTFLEMVREVDNVYNSIMIFGHNPSLEKFASYLLKNLEIKIPKSGLIEIEFRRRTWTNVKKQDGTLKYLAYPLKKSKKEKLEKEAKKEIKEILVEQIESFFDEIDPTVIEKMQKPIKKTSDKLAEEFVDVTKPYKLAVLIADELFKAQESDSKEIKKEKKKNENSTKN